MGGGVYGPKNVTGSSVVNGLYQLMKETTIFWDDRK